MVRISENPPAVTTSSSSVWGRVCCFLAAIYILHRWSIQPLKWAPRPLQALCEAGGQKLHALWASWSTQSRRADVEPSDLQRSAAQEDEEKRSEEPAGYTPAGAELENDDSSAQDDPFALD